MTAQIVSDSSGLSAPQSVPSSVLQAGSAQIVSMGNEQQEYAPVGQQQVQQPGTQQQQDPNLTQQQQPFDQMALLQAMMQQQQGQQPQQQPPAPLPQLDEAGQTWWNQFQQYTGLDRNQFTQGIQMMQQLPSIQQFVAQQQQQSMVQTLKQEWGNDFEAVMPEISKRFNALPPQMQVALDNLDGARLLYSQLMQERGSGRVEVPVQPTPRYDRPSTPQPPAKSNQEPTFTREQIRNMDEATYAKNQAAIMYAYSNGLVR